jgi:hypothetical protein
MVWILVCALEIQIVELSFLKFSNITYKPIIYTQEAPIVCFWCFSKFLRHPIWNGGSTTLHSDLYGTSGIQRSILSLKVGWINQESKDCRSPVNIHFRFAGKCCRWRVRWVQGSVTQKGLYTNCYKPLAAIRVQDSNQVRTQDIRWDSIPCISSVSLNYKLTAQSRENQPSRLPSGQRHAVSPVNLHCLHFSLVNLHSVVCSVWALCRQRKTGIEGPNGQDVRKSTNGIAG